MRNTFCKRLQRAETPMKYSPTENIARGGKKYISRFARTLFVKANATSESSRYRDIKYIISTIL